jgi:hypothetical protein
MSLQSAPYYWLECDNCHVKSTEEGEFSAWVNESSAKDMAEECEWVVESTRHLCEGCSILLACSKCGERRQDHECNDKD